MDARQIGAMGRELRAFLREFDGCFGRSEPREHLRTYVAGQVSDLPRKSIEPIALPADVAPRTLQAFLGLARWDEQQMVDRLQQIVVRDHGHPRAIGVIDETGDPKKGRHTAGVDRQWCGNTGKVDNCVVAVHLSYVADDFQCLLDSDLFLPKDWAEDFERRAEVKIPDDVVFRTKAQIALDQVGRALGNGVRVVVWTFDELYGRSRDFLDGLAALGQDYVGEVPSHFVGWTRRPRVLWRARPQDRPERAPTRRYPRLARKALPACRVDNLARHSPALRKQKWKRFRIKDGQRGPIVWEVKHCRFYRKQGPDGLPAAGHTLIVARNATNPEEVKYFVSNLRVGSEGVTLKWLLWVAFSRCPIERCFELAKRELGMDHFEVRSWTGIHRHLYISQLSQLFCARLQQRLREKNSQHTVPDGRAGPLRRLRVGSGPTVPSRGPQTHLSERRRGDRLPSGSQPTGASIPHQDDPETPPGDGHRRRALTLVQTR